MKITNFFPHRWLGTGLLRGIFLAIFYVSAVVFVYSAFNLVVTLCTPAEQLAANSAPTKQLWLSATQQSFAVGLFCLFIAHLLKALCRLCAAAHQNNPQ